MKSPLEAPEKQIAEETSAKGEKPAAAVIDTSKMAKGQREALELAEAARDRLRTPAVSRAIFSSAATISIEFIRIPRRALKIARPAKIFCKSWKVICAIMSIRTRSIAPAKFHRKISKDSRRSARLESKCRKNMAGSVCHNLIMDARRFCSGVGMETWPRSFLRINRSESRSR